MFNNDPADWYVVTMATYQECGSLKQQNFISINDISKVLQVGLYLAHVGYQLVHYG